MGKKQFLIFNYEIFCKKSNKFLFYKGQVNGNN